MIALFKFLTLFHFNTFRYGWLTLNEILIICIARKARTDNKKLLSSKYLLNFIAKFALTNKRISTRPEISLTGDQPVRLAD